jgi:hypothetical protein
MTSLFPLRESLISDILAGTGNIEKLSLQCIIAHTFALTYFGEPAMDFGENKVKKCGEGGNAVTFLNIFQQSLVLYSTFPNYCARDCRNKAKDRGNFYGFCSYFAYFLSFTILHL